MGSAISSIYDQIFGNLQARILLLGCDGAGKTTILYKMKLGELIHSPPTIGFNCEKVIYNKMDFTMWDIGGQDRIRKLWKHYYEGTDSLIFVIDCNDVERLPEASLELQKLLSEPQLRDAAVLVFANKQDLPNAVSPSSLLEFMPFLKDNSRVWHVQSTCAMSGDGVHEGMDWLVNALKKRRRNSAN
eukprot:TRINITY_DN3521_c0_g1_i2.p1 TRINITY_DN3521_c0_g1~~TRINITY_DN3521_c0_g1_i2.p1  ORF type:complete len:187 (+),score=26.08 TRINITY_DN3521_c0_g1_i2:68-628(+)